MLCIDVQNLTKSFGEHVVIDDLSLRVEEGEVVVLQGPSGVGKSTFLRCLTCLEHFQKGLVRVGDISIEAGLDVRRHRDTIRHLREQVGFVFQFFNLFPHLTILENLMLGPVRVQKRFPAEVEKEARALLERVGLSSKAAAHPSALSGGQKQRVGIARALAMRPRAVLFDEPTSALDPEMKNDVVDVIADFAKDGLTLLIVTHEPAVVERVATRVVRFGPACRVISDEKTS
jgi:ABC-type polar amino acid transport system ATPase subunit